MTEEQLMEVLIQLADQGVTGIKVHYDGGGDSGAIENIVYTDKEDAEFSDIDYVSSWDQNMNLATINSSAYATIENFAQETILDQIEDWWNNDGGFGDLLIKVPSGEYIVNNNVRIMEIEEFEHEGNLFRKTED
jgi:hypothetical protein